MDDEQSAVLMPELPPAETQRSVTEWANATFGPATSNARIAARANEEMAELLRALTADDDNPKAAEEIADVVIVLWRLATNLGVDLEQEIGAKMRKNRCRTWVKDASGHGYHVRAKDAALSAPNPAVELGRKGGLKGGPARAMALTGDERHAAASKAAKARWAKRRKEPPA